MGELLVVGNGPQLRRRVFDRAEEILPGTSWWLELTKRLTGAWVRRVDQDAHAGDHATASAQLAH